METNTQPIEKQELTPKGDLEIIKVWRTIQGEGPYAGRPAVFVRLAGCNLDCPLCDTNYTVGRSKHQVPDVLASIEEQRGACSLVVITGGEPFRQQITYLVKGLIRAGMDVQIETNGTLYLEDFPYDKVTIVCSPKTPLLNERLLPHIGYYKYVVGHFQTSEDDGLPTYVLGKLCKVARPPEGFSLDRVYVQPMDEQDSVRNAHHTKTAVESCMTFGWRCCLQTHKLMGLE